MRICLFGSEGRMGKTILQEAGDSVIARYDKAPPASAAGDPLPEDTQVVIDFSSPSAWPDLDLILSSCGAALVTGTTGLQQQHMEMLRRWAEDRPVFHSSNMSIGVYVLGRLLRNAGEMLPDDFVMELVELHHAGKVDSPSGTALGLVDIWEQCREEAAERAFGRYGPVGPRDRSETGIHSVRGGDVAGEHQVHLIGTGERLVLTHIATGRRNFALGALKAAEFVLGKEPGLYGMEDLLKGNG